MKNLFIFLFFLSWLTASGQETLLFKVICASPGVQLDGNEVTPGLAVYPNSSELSIPRKGYAGILTNDGYAYLLKRSMDVRNIVQYVYMKSNEVNRFDIEPGTLATHRGNNRRIIELVPAVAPANAYVSMDHFTIFWSDKFPSKRRYVVKFVDTYEQPLLTDTLDGNWATYDRNAIMGSESLIMFKIQPLGRNEEESVQHATDYQLIKVPGPDLIELKSDLARIAPDEADREIVEMAIYEIYGLMHDNFTCEFKLVLDKKEPRTEMGKNYLRNQSHKLFLGWFHFKP